MSQYFPKPYEAFSGDINVKVDLSNYATKADIKNISHVNTSSFALKANLANLKTEVDKLDIDKLVSVPLDLSKLSDVVKNNVIKKTDYDKLVTKVNAVDTSGFVLKTGYDESKLEKKIPDTSGLVKKTDYNSKITEIEDKIPGINNLATKILANKIENKIPDISNLATKAALAAVENKIPRVSNLVKKTEYSTKITNIENKLTNHDRDKSIDTLKFNTLATAVFIARLAQANLITKSDFDAKLSILNRKITKNKSKYLLVENELNKLKTFGSSYFIGKSHFGEDGTQHYLVFQPMFRYFRLITNTSNNLSRQSKGLYNENFDPPNTHFCPLIDFVGNKIKVKFNGSCLKQSNKISYTHGKIVNIYIVYEINKKDNTIISDSKL